MSGEELEVNDIEIKNDDLNLGAPDLSQFIDDEPEITSKDVSSTKAKTMLKPSYAINKLLPMVFSVIARVKGEHWLLADEEVEEFSTAFDECVEHYYPDMEALPPWAMLAVSSGMIVLPRLIFDGMSDEQKEMAQEQLKTLKNEEQKAGEHTVLRPKEA